MELTGPSITPTESDIRRWKLSDFEKMVSRHANCIRLAARAAAKAEADALAYIAARDSRAAKTEARKVALAELREKMETAQARRLQSDADAEAAAKPLYEAYYDALS